MPEMNNKVALITGASSEEEIADAVLWLCSDGVTFLTGQAIAIDGGYTTK